MPIFRVSIETRNILSLLQISKSSQILSKASLTVIVPEKRVPLYFFFFFYDTLSLEFPYITRVVYIIVSTQCCYYRVEIRFNTLQGRRIRIFFRRDVYSDFLVESSFFIHEIDGSLVQYKQVFTKILILSMLSSQEVYRYTLRILGEIYSK